MSDRPPAAVRETHTAVLWFDADRVHKMKKPVDLGFCDFTTVERRRQACEREVRLNRRLSPEVYEGVETLLDPAGRVREYMVAMRRMPADRSLAALLRAGGPVDDELRAVARRLAAFHEVAARGPEIDREGTVEALAGRWRGVLDGLRRDAVGLVDDGAVDRLDAEVSAFLAGRAPLLEARRTAGLIVDGHGDLIADDVYCLPTGPVLLDCLEFDDRLRYVDVLDDAAFLAMDLERIGGPSPARSFLDLYTEFAGDPAPDALRHHYVAYRAAVRAAVTAVRVGQGGPGSDDVRALVTLAAAHLEAGRVRLVLVGGLPGTGKTTLAGGVADRLGATLVSSDRLRKEMSGLTPTEPARAAYRDGLYRPERTEATYREPLHRAEELWGRGETVVLDASWSAEAHRRAAADLAVRAHAELAALRCEVPRAVADQRIRDRRGSASDATPLVAAVMAADADPWPEATTIDTAAALEVSVDHALTAVRRPVPHGSWTEVVPAGP